jgi:GntR family transcriptional repressor for pyruvate dehydrogenase complex
MFKKATQNRVFQNVIDQIQEAVLQGKLQAGEKLPAERELTELFGTSRWTLREALRVLEQKGLITIKTGARGGAFVRTVHHDTVSESLALLIRSQKVLLKDLAEFREGIEGIVAALAASRATARDIEGLKSLLEEAKSNMKAGVSHWQEFIRVDNRLHMALARISRNAMYELVLNTVHDNINRYYDRLLAKEERVMKRNYRDLCRMVEAVENRREEQARDIAREHVRWFTRLMMSRQLESEKQGE